MTVHRTAPIVTTRAKRKSSVSRVTGLQLPFLRSLHPLKQHNNVLILGPKLAPLMVVIVPPLVGPFGGVKLDTTATLYENTYPYNEASSLSYTLSVMPR